jgi:hypothetical protein
MRDGVCMQGVCMFEIWLVDSFRRRPIASNAVVGGQIPVVPFFRFRFYLLILLSLHIHLLLTGARLVVG